MCCVEVLLPSIGMASDEQVSNYQTSAPHFDKIYLSYDRVIVLPEGIFFLSNDGELLPARLVASDAQGLYVVAAFYQCPRCSRWFRSNKCENPACPLNGK